MESRLEIQAVKWDRIYDRLMKALRSNLPGHMVIVGRCMEQLDKIEERVNTFTPEEQSVFWTNRN